MAELSKVEQLAAQNLKSVPENPCVIWDQLVQQRMLADGCARSVAVDRLLAGGFSDVWLKCQSWDAAVPKILPDGTKSGNWLNHGNGIARRVPRAP